MVCTGPRCLDRGAGAVFDGVWASLEERRLAYYTRGGAVRLTSAGCLGACGYGPNVACYRRRDDDGPLEEAWYSDQTAASVVAIAEAIQSGADLPDPGRFD